MVVSPRGGLPGGKGGFGSLLRAIGAQIEKTTNHEAMRDLSGRRQRDLNNEKRMRDYVAKQGEREKEEREKKEMKLNKLRRLVDGENKDKYSLNDPLYDKVRSETEEKVHDAVEAAFRGAAEVTEQSSNDLKRKDRELNRGDIPPKKKKTGLWLDAGLDDLDVSDASDSDEEDSESNVVSVL